MLSDIPLATRSTSLTLLRISENGPHVLDRRSEVRFGPTLSFAHRAFPRHQCPERKRDRKAGILVEKVLISGIIRRNHGFCKRQGFGHPEAKALRPVQRNVAIAV